MEISRDSVKRLARDIKELKDKSLEENGIYYKHDEEDILKGYSLIYGPENTPYQYGNYLFEFVYPYDYPFTPPKVYFLTNADKIRMNPNLYRSGKVCISVLNTWKGEQWSSCQTIKTILLSIFMIFNDKPLLNEPGFREDNKDFDNYNKIIKYKNIDIAIYKVLSDKSYIFVKEHFIEIIINKFKENYKKIIDLTNNEKKIDDNYILKTDVYDMEIKVRYKDLNKKLKDLYNLLQN
tara:strand:- start:9607 stop:10314 length:708 start_codon:yes stop_codon:yes gene_type:complete